MCAVYANRQLFLSFIAWCLIGAFLSQMDADHLLDGDFAPRFLQIKRDFETLSNKIFNMLNSYKESSHRSSPQLAQLLLRIDYNDFFSRLTEKFERLASQHALKSKYAGY